MAPPKESNRRDTRVCRFHRRSSQLTELAGPSWPTINSECLHLVCGLSASKMKQSRIALIATIAAISASGCGTVCNFVGGIAHPESEPRVYGGVQRDLEILNQGWDQPSPKKDVQTQDPRVVFLLIPLAVAEGVLTVVGDTLTLPITIPLQRNRTSQNATLGTPRPLTDDESNGTEQVREKGAE
jgi:hypothetical protein